MNAIRVEDRVQGAEPPFVIPTAIARGAIATAWIVAATLSLQVLTGAYSAELSTPDEPAHFITALMIRDYIRTGLGSNPFAFASTYYLHYPKVAFGHWPPVFHVLSALWLLVAAPSRTSMLLMLAGVTSLSALLVYRIARAEWNAWVGIVAATAFLLLPVTQYVTNHVLADGLVSLLDLVAMLAWTLFMKSRKGRHAVVFGVTGALAMLTKGNGTALLALPFVAVTLSREWKMLRRGTFWVGPVVMVLLAGPWQLVTWRLLNGSVNTSGSAVGRLVAYWSLLRQDPGLLVLVLAAVGTYIVVVESRAGGSRQHLWFATAALAIVVLAFHVVTPIQPEIRYVFGAFPPLVLLASKGVAALVGRTARLERGLRVPLVALGAAICVWGFFTTFKLVRREHYGFDEVARSLVAETTAPDGVILTSSSFGNGMLIAEIAMLEQRPSRFVLRADKVLSSSTWDGYRYELKYRSPEAINAYLEDVPVDAIVVDEASSDVDRAHNDLIRETMSKFCENWRIVRQYHISGREQPVVVFRSQRRREERPKHIEIDMKYSLGRAIGTR